LIGFKAEAILSDAKLLSADITLGGIAELRISLGNDPHLRDTAPTSPIIS
jgi:hypothetical protein